MLCGMAFPFARALPILRGISELAGPNLREVDGRDLAVWLAERGEDWDVPGFKNAFFALRDADLVKCHFTSHYDAVGACVTMIRLGTSGRQAVEGWPSAGAIDAEALAGAIVSALHAKADDPALSDDARNALRKLADTAMNAAVNASVAAGMRAAGVA